MLIYVDTKGQNVSKKMKANLIGTYKEDCWNDIPVLLLDGIDKSKLGNCNANDKKRKSSPNKTHG